MAFFTVHAYSRVLQADTEFLVTLPGSANQPGAPLRTLWVLHGAFGDCMGSHNLVSIEREAGARDMAAVFPSVYHGFYADMAHGEKWYTFLNEEFMPMVRGMFARLSPRRADNYLLGLSMGGYGAFKWALNEPGTFAAAGACASPLDIKLVMHRLERGLHPGGHDLFDAFGSEARVAGTQDDVMDVLKKQLAAGVPLPKLFQLCGTDDFGWEENTLARDKMQAMGAPLTMVSGPGGHNEMFWDQYLTQFLDWLPKEVD